jgi:hypothetical protein
MTIAFTLNCVQPLPPPRTGRIDSPEQRSKVQGLGSIQDVAYALQLLTTVATCHAAGAGEGGCAGALQGEV